MNLLTYANWKKQIPFDNIVYKEVKRYSLRLNSFEREIMDAEIDYYRQNFSLLQVMNHFKILRTDLSKEIFIKAVLKRQDRLLFIPEILVPYFRKKIREEFSDFSEFFTILLNRATSNKAQNTLLPVIEKIFGGYFEETKKRVEKYRKIKPSIVYQKILKPESYQNTARDMIQSLQFDTCLSSIYGRSDIRRNVPISIVDDYGYGEWVSKNTTYNSTNRLFIYSNNNKLTDKQLEHMIYFNVYPGYGYFFDTVADLTNTNNFDNGATYLINGWAMYAMCKSKITPFATNMLIEGANIAHHLLKKNLKKPYEDIYIYLLSKYTKAKAIEYMLDYTQYPGHYLSYILGAIATELILEDDFANNPVDYLNTLKTIDCGDFFALYSRKMQKKIAKSNIVAKVSKKYS